MVLNESHRRAVVVLGMHRSGTSAMTRVLSLAGASLPKEVIPASEHNAAGFWESQEIVDFNDRVLRDLDTSWDDPLGPDGSRSTRISVERYIPGACELIKRCYDGDDFIVLKDPRNSLLLGLWREALKACGFATSYVIMLRHPLEVAASLRRRDRLGRSRSFLLWATYMLAAERDTRGEKRVVVKYEDLLADSEAVLDRVEERLGVQLPRRTWRALVEIESFLSVELRHNVVPTDDKVMTRFGEIKEFYSYLDALAMDEPWNVDAASSLDVWLQSLTRYVGPIFKAFERDLRDQAAELETARHASAEALHALEGARAEASVAQQRAERIATEAAATAALLAGLHVQLSAARAEIGGAEERVSEAVRRQEAAEAQRSDLELQLSTVRSEFAVASSRADEAQRRAEAAEMCASDLEAQLSAAKTEFAAARHRADEIERRAETGDARIADLEAQLVAARAEGEARVEAASARAAELNAVIIAAERRNVELQSELTKAHEEGKRGLSELRRQIGQLEAAAATREAALHRDVVDARADCRVAQEQSEALARELLSAFPRRRMTVWSMLRRR